MHHTTLLKQVCVLCAVVLVMLTTGCAKKALESQAYGSQPAAAEPPPEGVRAKAALFATANEATLAPEAAEMPDDSDKPSSGRRMLHHNGYMKLRTPNPRKLMEKAVDIVEGAGGYVERLEGNQGVFRVPVKDFETIFDQLLTLGDMLDKSITTQDITEAFMDVDLRLSIARTTRKRLVDLLAKAKTEKEKIKLLREIQRVSEKIEYLTGQREQLLSLARYSRITLTAVPRTFERTHGNAEDIKVFKWIYALSPFRRDVAAQGKVIAFQAPENMVVIDKKRLWAAESADGAVVWASRHDRQPRGDTAFWVEAIRRRLEPEFKDVRTTAMGDFTVLRMVSRTEKPYVYVIGIRVTEKKMLDLVEIYYPSLEQETRYSKAVKAAVEGGVQ